MAQNVLSITQLTEYIRGRLDDDPFLGQVAVRGEISNYKVYPSGHHYFTLKDEGAALKCVMFKGNAMRLRFRPDNGMKVIAMGKVTVYPRDGASQLYCAAMALDGGEDGLDFYRSISEKWKEALAPGGRLYFEVGIGQADNVLRIMRTQGFGDIQVVKDHHDIPRVVFGTLCTEL